MNTAFLGAFITASSSPSSCRPGYASLHAGSIFSPKFSLLFFPALLALHGCRNALVLAGECACATGDAHISMHLLLMPSM